MTASILLGIAAAVAVVLEALVHLPSVPCTVPSAVQADALSQASDSVYHWAHWAEVLSTVGIVMALVGLFLARRSVFVLCAVVLLAIGVFAAGYADYAANRGCGI